MTVAIYSVVRFRAQAGRHARRRADPRQHAARGRLGDDPVPDGHRARDLRLGRARRHRGQAAQHADRERDRAAVHLVLRLPQREGQVQRAGAAQGPPRGVPHPHQGRAPLVLGPRVPAQVGRGARADHQDPPHAQPDRPLPGGVRGAVRHRPLHDAPERARGRHRRVQLVARRPEAGRRRRRRAGREAAEVAAAVPSPTARPSSPTTAAPAATRSSPPTRAARSAPTSTRSTTRPRPSSSSRSSIPTRWSRRDSSRTSCPRTSATRSRPTNSTLSWSTF